MTITLRQLTVRRGGRTILGPLDWTVDDGQRWVVLGANGSGKTTLLSVAGMSLWPTSGSVEVLGERYGKVDARELRRRIGSAGSATEAAMRPDLTARDLIMTARHGASSRGGTSTMGLIVPGPRTLAGNSAWTAGSISRSGACLPANSGARPSPGH